MYQFLNVEFHCMQNHKLGMIKTLYNICDNIVMEAADMEKETVHVNLALPMHVWIPQVVIQEVAAIVGSEGYWTRKKESNEKWDERYNFPHHPIHQGPIKGIEQCVLQSHSCDYNETPADPQEDVGTPQEQEDTAGDPLQRLPQCLHKLGCEKIWY